MTYLVVVSIIIVAVIALVAAKFRRECRRQLTRLRDLRDATPPHVSTRKRDFDKWGRIARY